MIEAVKLISSLWDDPEMNVLMLLAAAFELISRMHTVLKRVR